MSRISWDLRVEHRVRHKLRCPRQVSKVALLNAIARGFKLLVGLGAMSEDVEHHISV